MWRPTCVRLQPSSISKMLQPFCKKDGLVHVVEFIGREKLELAKEKLELAKEKLELAQKSERKKLELAKEKLELARKSEREKLELAKEKFDLAEQLRREHAQAIERERQAGEAKLSVERGTLSRRWVLETVLQQCHAQQYLGKPVPKFNATQTAGAVGGWSAAKGDAIVDTFECWSNCNKPDVAKMYGKLSQSIHSCGVDWQGFLQRPSDLTLDEHNFLLCIAQKRFKLP